MKGEIIAPVDARFAELLLKRVYIRARLGLSLPPQCELSRERGRQELISTWVPPKAQSARKRSGKRTATVILTLESGASFCAHRRGIISQVSGQRGGRLQVEGALPILHWDALMCVCRLFFEIGYLCHHIPRCTKNI